jgi:hypothetical protein
VQRARPCLVRQGGPEYKKDRCAVENGGLVQRGHGGPRTGTTRAVRQAGGEAAKPLGAHGCPGSNPRQPIGEMGAVLQGGGLVQGGGGGRRPGPEDCAPRRFRAVQPAWVHLGPGRPLQGRGREHRAPLVLSPECLQNRRGLQGTGGTGEDCPVDSKCPDSLTIQRKACAVAGLGHPSSTGSSPVVFSPIERGWIREGPLKDSRPFVFSPPGLFLRRALRLQDASNNPGDCRI